MNSLKNQFRIVKVFFFNISFHIILKYTLKLSITVPPFKFTNRIIFTTSIIEMLVFPGLEILI